MAKGRRSARGDLRYVLAEAANGIEDARTTRGVALFRRAAFWWWLVGWLFMPFRWDVVWEQLFRRLTGG